MADDNKTIIKPRPRPARAAPSAAASDQTVIKPRPRPGGGGAPERPQSGGDDRTVVKPRKTRNQHLPLNLGNKKSRQVLKQSPLIDAASTLLSLTPQLRQINSAIEATTLHQYVTDLVRDFEAQCRSSIGNNEIRENASYVLCSLIDETVLNTPWGENSDWSRQTLLSLFHKETYGGEKVFTILDEAMESPDKYYELIELIYLALSLGFMGKLRIDPKGQVIVEHIRSQAYNQLNKSRERFEKTLSANLTPATGLKYKLNSFLPVWLLISTLILVGFATYTYWLVDLNKRSDAMSLKLTQVTPTLQEAQLPENGLNPQIESLRDLLAPEIERKILSVNSFRTHFSIVLHAEELFGSGSAVIAESYYPVLDKISKALESISGRCTVSGHTDNVAIRTTRFPSNWHLSLARASAVVKYMASVASLEGRLLPEGRGESMPVASNKTTEGRAKNRRVVIDVFQAATR
jgi:type VI secretion system protein ImpK